MGILTFIDYKENKRIFELWKGATFRACSMLPAGEPVRSSPRRNFPSFKAHWVVEPKLHGISKLQMMRPRMFQPLMTVMRPLSHLAEQRVRSPGWLATGSRARLYGHDLMEEGCNKRSFSL